MINVLPAHEGVAFARGDLVLELPIAKARLSGGGVGRELKILNGGATVGVELHKAALNPRGAQGVRVDLLGVAGGTKRLGEADGLGGRRIGVLVVLVHHPAGKGVTGPGGRGNVGLLERGLAVGVDVEVKAIQRRSAGGIERDGHVVVIPAGKKDGAKVHISIGIRNLKVGVVKRTRNAFVGHVIKPLVIVEVRLPAGKDIAVAGHRGKLRRADGEALGGELIRRELTRLDKNVVRAAQIIGVDEHILDVDLNLARIGLLDIALVARVVAADKLLSVLLGILALEVDGRRLVLGEFAVNEARGAVLGCLGGRDCKGLAVSGLNGRALRNEL